MSTLNIYAFPYFYTIFNKDQLTYITKYYYSSNWIWCLYDVLWIISYLQITLKPPHLVISSDMSTTTPPDQVTIVRAVNLI